jgi:serine/threonine protein kinase
MNTSNLPTWASVLLVVATVTIAMAVLVAVLVPTFRVVGWVVRQVFTFIGAELRDLFRLIGMVLTAVVLSPLAAFSVLFGRWSRAEHYGRAINAEVKAMAACVYRMAVGHPLRLVGAGGVVEGLEERVPAVVAHAPPPTELPTMPLTPREAGARPSRGGQFPGYTILGTLPGGGSGGRLYIARPDATKLAALQRQGFAEVGDVVIKSFNLSGPGGSTLPQIVRENRALEAAKRMGLVLEHELANDRFFYVMRYVPGDSLGLVAQRLHAASGAGLAGRPLAEALGYVADLVGTLADYHKAGLWHKDVKPDNIIVAGGHAHLVDFGLVTPLRSSMTLTTHGTEYFRDPELVRLAMKGVKVHEVDGAKFDLYAAGAVLYAVVENSFPAHGGLSQVSKPCPDSIKWIIRRAMTDYDKRYPNALAMLADLREVHRAAVEGRLESLRPADLPSVRDGDAVTPAPLAPVPELANHTPPPSVGRFHGRAPADAPSFGPANPGVAAARQAAATPRRSAGDQLRAARTRVAERQRRAADRRSSRQTYSTAPKASSIAIAGGSVLFLGTIIGVSLLKGDRPEQSVNGATTVSTTIEQARVAADQAAAAIENATEQAKAVQQQAAEIVGRAREQAQRVLTASIGERERASKGKRSNGAAKAVPGDLGRGAVLMVLQEPAALSEEAVDAAEATLGRLDDHGFTFTGVSPLIPEHAASATLDAGELEAGLRGKVGLRVLPGPEAAAEIRAWLADHPEVSGVLWLVRNPEQPDALLQWFIPSAGLDGARLTGTRRLLEGE